jgi:hypothetical protein
MDVCHNNVENKFEGVKNSSHRYYLQPMRTRDPSHRFTLNDLKLFIKEEVFEAVLDPIAEQIRAAKMC